MKRYILILIALLFLCACSVSSNSYGVFIGISDADVVSVHDYDLVVVDAGFLHDEAASKLKANGNKRVFSYLNVGAIENFRPEYERFESIALGAYEDWQEEYWIDVSNAEWREYVTAKAQGLVDEGIDGLFLDNFDVYYRYPTREIYDALLGLLERFKEMSVPVIINGADYFVVEAINNGDLKDLVYGINQETVFTSIDFEDVSFGEQSIEHMQYYKNYVELCADKGMEIFLLEYGADSTLEGKIREYCKERGFTYYNSRSLELLIQ